MSQNESFRVAGSPHVSQPSGFAALASRWLTSMGSPPLYAVVIFSTERISEFPNLPSP